jgi:signal transduction histidine kinase
VVAAAEERPDTVIETRALVLRGRFGTVGHALILTDRTEAETSRRRLALAGRLEALGSMTAGIAHEVNNPLAYVQANLSSLATTAKQLTDPTWWRQLPEPLRESVADMEGLVDETREGLERIRLLVQRLKSFSRAPDLSASSLKIDLVATIRQAVAVAEVGRPESSIRIEARQEPRIATLEGAVFQILVNLLLNAVQATSGSVEDHSEIVVRLESSREGVTIAVADRGPGIPVPLLPRIFDPFFTTKPTGTGLGLSLSYDLAQKIGGHLEAANRDGGGAVFTLWLPFDPPQPEDREALPAVS